MKDWIKNRFKQTPERRISNAFWLGTVQAIISMTFFQSFGTDSPVADYWILLLVLWIAVGVIYIKNAIAFKKETLWMTIKNPAKVTREELDLTFPNHPIAPPPPPPPRYFNG